MKKLLIASAATAALFLIAARTPTWAIDANGKITVREALTLAVALRNLDGHPQNVTQDGKSVNITVPWEFGSGSLRLRIANDIAIVEGVERSLDKARRGILGEILKKTGGTKLETSQPEFSDFQAQIEQLLDEPAAGTQDLAKIKASELKLDKNEISVTVLAALRPVLENDQ